MKQEAILLLEADENARRRIEQELDKRYGIDYQIFSFGSASKALAQLEQLRDEGQQVIAILASYWLPESNGIEFLQKARRLHAHASRGILLDWGDRAATDGLLRGLALGTVDAYGPKPSEPGDEHFHSLISNFLHTWAMQHGMRFTAAQIVGEQWSPRCHQLRDLLERNAVPYAFHTAGSEEGRGLLQQASMSEKQLPVVIMASGEALIDPSNAELAQALNVSTTYGAAEEATDQPVDVVIVGAGPAGLSAAVYSASEGLRTIIIEGTALGGQAGMSSRIRNYLGFPLGISGNELAGSAYQQAIMFGTQFIFVQHASGLEVEDDNRIVRLTDGSRIRTRAVVLATGITYRQLNVPRLDELMGAGVFYGAADTEAMAMKDQPVFVVGGGNSAGQAAVHLARFARKVTMVVRGRSLATSMSEYLIKEIENSDNIEVRLNSEVIDGRGDYRLEQVVLKNRVTGETETLDATGLFVLIGAIPSTDWLPPEIERTSAGFIITGHDLIKGGKLPPQWPLAQPPLLLETSMPRVFACGDVRHRSVKRVASAVGEGSIAVQLLHQVLSE